MPLTPGTYLGPYEILSAIGAGGMGEVYRVHDAKLNRDVALKVLPDLPATDPDRLARFHREAQILATLNHPNIAHIYGFEDSGATHAIVMELVEGPTLADRIAGRAIPVAEALPIARQIADALEAAHEQGIVHRDLKPANVKVRDDGTVKVLDFGLAKALDAGSGADVMNSPTLTARATQLGTLLGTAAYMAPEQARGKAVDKRADVWAFGVVLYEMLTGTRAFGGDDIAETLASVLKDTPSLAALPAATPVRLRHLIERCLERDVKQRLRDIGEARIEIAKVEAGATDESASLPAVTVPASRPLVPWMLLAAVCVALVGTLLRWSPWRSAPPLTHVISRNEYALPEDLFFTHAGGRVLAISQDGTKIAYVADRQLYLKPVDRLEAQPIPGTNEDPFDVVFSPDGQWLAYFVVGGTGGKLRKIAASGGVPVTLCETETWPFGMSWRNGMIAFGQNNATINEIQSVPDIGGTSRTLVSVDPKGGRAAYPQLLDDGRHVLFTVMGSRAEDDQIVVQAFDGTPRKVVVTGGTSAQLLSTGQLVYANNGTLLAVSFDAKRLAVIGGAETILDGVKQTGGPRGVSQYVVSREGTLAYFRGPLSGTRQVLVWVDGHGKEQPIAAKPRDYGSPRLSPDGKKIAVPSNDEDHDVWIWDLATENLRQLTHGPAIDTSPVWIPGTQQLVYESTAAGRSDIFRVSADKTGAAVALTKDGTGGAPLSISPDGKVLVYRTLREPTHLMLLPLDGTGPAVPLGIAPERSQVAVISPNGRWIAYTSGRPNQIFVRAFPVVEGGRVSMVSRATGFQPTWAPNGRDLLFLEGVPPSRLMSVTIRSETTFSYSAPKIVADLSRGYGLIDRPGRWYDVAADGRVLTVKTVGNEVSQRDTIITVAHWFDEVAARVK